MDVAARLLATFLLLEVMAGGSAAAQQDQADQHVVHAGMCRECLDTFGVAQFLQTFGGTHGTTLTILSGTRSKAGDAIVVGFNGYNASGVKVSSIEDYCGNKFTPLKNLNAYQGNTIQLFYAWNVRECESDLIKLQHSNAAYTALYSWDIRFADNLSDPFDVEAEGTNRLGSPVTTSNFSTSAPNEIIIALAWSNNYASCAQLAVGTIGGVQATPDSVNAPMSGLTCPYNVAEHALTNNKESQITASASWGSGQPGGGIVVAAFRRLSQVPNSLLVAKFDAKVATSASWSKSGNVITFGKNDPPPSQADINKILFGTISTSGRDGNMTAGRLAIPQSLITAVNGNQVTISQAAVEGSLPPNSDGFTGFVVVCNNDTDAMRAAWERSLATDGGTLMLPAGMACFDGPLFVNTSGAVYNRSVVGFSASATILIPLPQFQYDPRIARSQGLVYYDYGAGILGQGSAETQKSTGATELRNWSIWGADQPGINVTWRFPPLPFIYAVRSTLTNVACGSWNNGFGMKTDNSVPGFVLSGSVAINGQNFGCGNAGIELRTAPTTQFASVVVGGAYGWTWGAGLVISQASLSYSHQSFGAYYGTSDYPDHSISAVLCNLALCQRNGNFVSHGDTYYGSIAALGGSTSLLGTAMPKINEQASGLSIMGGRVSAEDSIIPSFSISSGSFTDNGNNVKSPEGKSWTTGTLLISGGQIYRSESVTGTVQTAANWKLLSGSRTGQWGTSPSVDCPGTLFAQAGDSHREACTITVGSGNVGLNPVVIIKFPTPFAVPPICDAKAIEASRTITILTSVPTRTGINLTYQGRPPSEAKIGIEVTCGP
jgi:hypothetical protein